jgi:PAS domain S-box-containing protein
LRTDAITDARQKKSPHTSQPGSSASPIVHDGEIGKLIRKYSWDKTSLGPIDSWPQSLLTALNILLQSPVPIVMLWGKDGIMLYNDAYSVFAGKRHPTLLGSKVVEGWPEVADFNQHVMDTVYEEGKTLSYKDQELVLYRNDVHEDVWMDLNYSPIIDESGKPGGVWSIVVETTERVLAEQKQQAAEAALKSEREHLQSLFKQAPALIAVLRGPNHTFEMANPLYIDTVAPHRDIVGKPVIEALPELAGQGIIDILDTVLRTNKPYVGELAVKLDRHNSGQLEDAYFNLVYQPISTTSGKKPDGIFVHAVEITDQVTSRKHTEQLNAQLEAVLESIPDGLYIADHEKITRINQRGAEVLGYQSPDEVPRSLEELYQQLSVQYIDSDHKLTVKESTIGNALRGKAVQHHGVRVVNPLTGKEQILRTAGAPVRDKDGLVIGAIAVNYDQTDQYLLQERIQKETIKRRVLVQKAKLLKEQNEQLTTLNTMKDEFIALTSHQLRTPATGVKQYVGMLMQGFAGELTPEQLQFLERAYASNERQLHIIDDILRVARVDLGQLEIHKQPHDLGQLLQDILEEQASQFKNHQLTLDSDLPSNPLLATVDANQLHMAIGNIIDNAIKYTPDSKRITVRLAKIQPKLAQIEIIDQGVGIAEADMAKLFQKFSRIANQRSVQVGGTGLGLYWSKRILELHDGTITATSQPDKGTSFTITIPLVRTAAAKR